MTLRAALTQTEAIADRLPFGLDEYDRVDAAYQAMREEGTEQAQFHVELWTYCYIRRYFLFKFLRSHRFRAGDLDLLIDKTFRKVEKHRGGLQLPARYAAWVSVVCRNTFLNRVRVKREYRSVDDEVGPVLRASEEEARHDAATVLQAVDAAIGRLPTYMQEAARQRLLYERSYDEVAALLDIKMSLARTYTSKALKRLRSDEGLQDFRRYLKE